MATARKYARETLWALASKGVAFVFYYGLVYFLTRQMTVEVWGDWSAFLALLNIILLISDQGINAASKRYLAETRDSSELGGLVCATLTFRVVASLLFTAVIALFFRPLLSWLHQTNHTRLMQHSLLLIALYQVMDYFKSLFEALHRLRSTFIINAVEHGLKLFLVLLLYRGGDEFFTIVRAFTVAVAVALTTGLVVTSRTIPGGFVPVHAWPNIRQLYLYSLPIFLVSIASFISLEIDTIMLKNLVTDYETGIYSAAKQIVIFLPHIAVAFSMGIIPGISIFDETAAPISRRLYYRMLGVLAGLYLVVCLGIVMFARWGMSLFFRPEYHVASTTLLVLMPFVIFNAATIFSGSLMIYRGLAWQRVANVGVAITANVFLNWLLIPRWGAIGAAAASSLAYLPYCVLNLRAADKAFSTRPV
jgi:O-antigen/teichoic acid export membrane protein